MRNPAFEAFAQMCIRKLFSALLASSFLCASLCSNDWCSALVIVGFADKAGQ